MLLPRHCFSTALTLQLTHKPERQRRAPVRKTHPACSLNQLLCRYYTETRGMITSLGRHGHMLATSQGSEPHSSRVTVSPTEAPLVTPPSPTYIAPRANSRAALTLPPSPPSAPRTKTKPARAQKPECPRAQNSGMHWGPGAAVCLEAFARMENTSADRCGHILWAKDGDKRKKCGGGL